MRILLTGVSGFVGRYLLLECQKRYPQARIYGIVRNSFHRPDHLDEHAISLLQADIEEAESIEHAVKLIAPDLLFHLAAQSSVATSWNEPAKTLHTNALGAFYLLEAARKHCPGACIVLVGSSEEYGAVAFEENPISEEAPLRPCNPYAISKATQSMYGYQYVVAYNMNVLRVRAFNHFGPYQSEKFVVASFASQIARIERKEVEPVLRVGDMQVKRDFLAVQDVVRAYIAVAERGKPGEVYNVGSGKARSIGSIVEKLLGFATHDIEVRPDATLLRPVNSTLLEADITHVRQQTGWEPMDIFEEALKETFQYWMQGRS